MATRNYSNILHIGNKIEKIRRLRGITQAGLGEALGITKQAISKIEQSEYLDEERIKEVANALGVTHEGLKKFQDGKVLGNTLILNEDHDDLSLPVMSSGIIKERPDFLIEKTIERFEELLEKERIKYELVKRAGN